MLRVWYNISVVGECRELYILGRIFVSMHTHAVERDIHSSYFSLDNLLVYPPNRLLAYRLSLLSPCKFTVRNGCVEESYRFTLGLHGA